ncbi:DUF302 domain-containing protein [Desertibacillus haloalkaliphilus]|uniref:DUF302 domain-containing protein n=1 Tax=Desertibacillus haloalkaliphilus TaxID=1328930 RepID=UPI001C25B630|nr:DUF302 domain-containing protein [Desertibacillus haloalkaliphilus]MBU8908708.1 DUF302 domain-containing protein [Desertibacillus haloalkaliphilus]
MFDYTVETQRSIDEAIENLKASLIDEQFGVLWEFDIEAKLQEKGLDFNQPYKVLEVCNPHEAKRVLDKNKMAGYFLPCKIVVYRDQEVTKIGMPRPTALIKNINNEDLNEVAADIEKRLEQAINQSI